MTAASVHPEDRFTSRRPCAICRGHAGMRRHAGARCHGYLADDGAVAFCARVESRKQTSDLWRHFLFGPCDCGATHNPWESAPPHLRDRGVRMNGSAKGNGGGPKLWTVSDDNVETIHVYDDPDTREVLFELVRFTRDARERLGAKAMPRHSIGGRWYFGAGSWAGRSDVLPLYRQREAVAELEQGGTVRLVEGERDVDAIHEAGGVAACNAWGALKFRDAHARTLAEALAAGAPSAVLEIVVDLDGDGRRHAEDVLRKLRSAGAPSDRIRIAQPVAGKDAADHLAAGFGLGDFEPLAIQEAAEGDDAERKRDACSPSLEAVAFTGQRLLGLLGRPRPQPVEAGRPVPGHFKVLVAPPMVGKTTLALWNAMAAAAGVAPWPEATANPAGRVLIYSLDEAPEQVARRMHGLATFHPAGRLERYAERLVVIGPDREIDPGQLDALRFDDKGLATLTRWLEEAEASGAPFAEIYVDAFADMIPLGESENSNEEATRIGGALERLAVRFGAAIVLLHHTGKPKADSNGEEADVRWLGRGASALAAKARVVSSLELVAGMPHLRRVRTATNLGPAPRPRLFEVCAPDAQDDELLFFKPAPDALERDPNELLALGEKVTTGDLARRLAGDSAAEGSEAPGEFKRQAAALRESWRRAGKVRVTPGARGAKVLELVSEDTQ